MFAPKGPGSRVRQTYKEGFGIPGLVAIERDATGDALQIALGLAKAVGLTRAGVIETTTYLVSRLYYAEDSLD